jgi:flagellar biosynthetic protein FliQ
MSVEQAIDLTREAAVVALMVGSPIVLAGMLVGLIVSILQAVTQVHEQTLSFVPKLIAMVVATALCLPWMMARMVEYTSDLVHQIPSSLAP